MRGHRKLEADGRPDAIDSLCDSLAHAPIPTDPNAFSPLIYGAAIADAELATRQVLYLRFALYKITAPLFALCSRPGAQLVWPLPSFWIETLRKRKVPVHGLASRVLWVGALLLIWAYGLATAARLVGQAIVAKRSGFPSPRNVAHFEYVGVPQTPRPDADGRSFDVISWYRHWPRRDPSVTVQTYRTHTETGALTDPNVRGVPLPVQPDLPWSRLLRFIAWAVAASALSLVDIARGRWWHALMFHEAVLARFVAAAKPTAVARDYLFNNSGWFHRPLWTYEAEARGSQILFYHYSTNSAQFKTATGYRAEHHAWSLSNWPLHLVWDHHNEAFVQRAVGRATSTEIVGPIWFASSPEPLPPITRPALAVFDVTPFRPAAAPRLALPANYYRPATCNQFITDVARASRAHGMHLVWKRKRNVGKAAHPAYRTTLETIDAQGSVEVISAEHSPIPVIEAAEAVISMPFTSTAHLARHMGKPSCYYDPTGEVQKDDRAAHDIPILHGYDELDSWIRSLRTEANHSG